MERGSSGVASGTLSSSVVVRIVRLVHDGSGDGRRVVVTRKLKFYLQLEERERGRTMCNDISLFGPTSVQELVKKWGDNGFGNSESNV